MPDLRGPGECGALCGPETQTGGSPSTFHAPPSPPCVHQRSTSLTSRLLTAVASTRLSGARFGLSCRAGGSKKERQTFRVSEGAASLAFGDLLLCGSFPDSESFSSLYGQGILRTLPDFLDLRAECCDTTLCLHFQPSSFSVHGNLLPCVQ